MAQIKISLKFISAMIVLGLMGCATAPGKEFTDLTESDIEPNKGIIYIYRSSSMFYAAGTVFDVKVNGKKVGQLFNGSYLAISLPAGRHRIVVDPGAITLADATAKQYAEIAPKQTLYYHFYFSVNPLLANMINMGATLEVKDKQIALSEIKSLKGSTSTPLLNLETKGFFADIEDVNAIPYLQQNGRNGYLEWLKKPKPKAFVITPSGKWNSTWGSKPKDLTEPSDPIDRAILHCQKRKLADCKLYAADDDVVWEKE